MCSSDLSEEPRSDTFRYKGGLVDFVNHLNAKRDPLHAHIIDIADVSDDAELEVALQWTTSYTESVLSFEIGRASCRERV